jgi:hypothetical protein
MAFILTFTSKDHITPHYTTPHPTQQGHWLYPCSLKKECGAIKRGKIKF